MIMRQENKFINNSFKSIKNKRLKSEEKRRSGINLLKVDKKIILEELNKCLFMILR